MPINYIKPSVPKVSLGIGEEAKKAEPITRTPPVQPPEYYTGYQTELAAKSKNVYQTSKRVETAYKALSSAQTNQGWVGTLKNIGKSLIPGRGVLLPNQKTTEKDIQAAQAEFDAATVAMRSSEWQVQILHTLP